MTSATPFQISRRFAVAALAACACGIATAQDSAGRPARIVLGSLPGASSDAVARLLAESFSKALGRTFIVENKPGASSNIAADHVAKSAPDGSTLLLVYNAHPAVGALFPNLPYDPIRDFRSVGMVGTTPYMLVANPAIPGRNLAEVLAHARTSRKGISFGSPGAGTPQHLTMERLKKEAGVDINMVHYKSSAPAQNDVIAGHVDITLSTPSLAMAQVKAGKLKALAVTSAQRLPDLPDVGTVTEAGVKGFVSVGWFALLVPAATPAPVVAKYNEVLNAALSSAPLKDRLLAQGITPAPGTPEVLDKQMQGDAAIWSRLIRELGIKPE